MVVYKYKQILKNVLHFSHKNQPLHKWTVFMQGRDLMGLIAYISYMPFRSLHFYIWIVYLISDCWVTVIYCTFLPVWRLSLVQSQKSLKKSFNMLNFFELNCTTLNISILKWTWYGFEIRFCLIATILKWPS